MTPGKGGNAGEALGFFFPPFVRGVYEIGALPQPSLPPPEEKAVEKEEEVKKEGGLCFLFLAGLGARCGCGCFETIGWARCSSS